MDFMENITILLTLALAIATRNGSLSSCDVDSCPRDQSFVTNFLKTCWHSLTHSDNIVSAFHFHFSSHSSLISLSLTRSMPKPKRGSWKGIAWCYMCNNDYGQCVIICTQKHQWYAPKSILAVVNHCLPFCNYPSPHSNNCKFCHWHLSDLLTNNLRMTMNKTISLFNVMMIISVVSGLGSEWVVDRSQRVVVTFTLDAGTATKMIPWSQLEEKTTLPLHYLGQYFDPAMPLTWHFLRCFGELAPILA